MAEVLPTVVRVELGHAAAQVVADRSDVRMLHIKGPALDPRLRRGRAPSTDADVLVDPDEVDRLLDDLVAAGWDLRASFRSGSIFEHAATLWHEHWGYLDVHRRFPGVTLPPATAFARLWAERAGTELAGRACPVPSLAAQGLLLVLHEARGPLPLEQHAWWAEIREDAGLEAAVVGLRDELGAHVAFAAATGDLEAHRDDPSYRLWRHARGGGSRWGEWRARVVSAPTWRARARLLGRGLLVNEDHLAMRLGRAPTTGELLRESLARLRRALTELRARR